MTIITLWLLLSVSDGSYNRGNALVVERFATAEQCEHVRKHLAKLGSGHDTQCVQAQVAR